MVIWETTIFDDPPQLLDIGSAVFKIAPDPSRWIVVKIWISDDESLHLGKQFIPKWMAQLFFV